MTQHDRPIERRPLGLTDIEEGGWQKPVKPPIADARPMGMPQASPAQAQPQAGAGGDAGAGGGDAGAGGAGAQGDGDA